MKRREFVVSSALGSMAAMGGVGARFPFPDSSLETSSRMATRKILIAGGGYNTPFIRYMAQLTGKRRPKILYLPTASADSAAGALMFYKSCATLDVEPSVQN